MKNAQKQKDHEKENLIDSRWAFRGHIVQLKLNTYQYDHKTKIAEIIHHPGAVVIVPVDDKERILFVQQWRRAAGEIMIELPAGTLEKNELPESCAKRELQEETGFSAMTMTALGGFFSAPGFCNEYLHLFIAEHLKPDPLPPDEDEMIDLLPATFSEAIQMVEENMIHDAKTIAGLFRYQLWKAQCEKS